MGILVIGSNQPRLFKIESCIQATKHSGVKDTAYQAKNQVWTRKLVSTQEPGDWESAEFKVRQKKDSE